MITLEILPDPDRNAGWFALKYVWHDWTDIPQNSNRGKVHSIQHRFNEQITLGHAVAEMRAAAINSFGKIIVDGRLKR